jgi:hypothetical protein
MPPCRRCMIGIRLFVSRAEPPLDDMGASVGKAQFQAPASSLNQYWVAQLEQSCGRLVYSKQLIRWLFVAAVLQCR